MKEKGKKNSGKLSKNMKKSTKHVIKYMQHEKNQENMHQEYHFPCLWEKMKMIQK